MVIQLIFCCDHAAVDLKAFNLISQVMLVASRHSDKPLSDMVL